MMQHLPVLQAEVVEMMSWTEPLDCILDLTLGGGGHLAALLEANALPKKVIAVDRDLFAIEQARKRLRDFADIEYWHRSFSSALERTSLQPERIFLDLGVSSFQLDEASRGFSFRKEGPLDMRMDVGSGKPLSDWVNACREEDLAHVLWEYGEERRSRPLARKLVSFRKKRSIQTTKDLVEAFGFHLDSRDRQGHHPLTRAFQALRIFINQEFEELDKALDLIPKKLAKNGRVSIISFHSLEDRRVKWSLKGRLRPINKKVICAQEGEQKANPRSRSAKLRVYEKLE